MNTLQTEAELAQKYGYQPLSTELSNQYRTLFIENIPQWIKRDGDHCPLSTKNGMQFARSYNRVVVGDYGAFIEIDKSDIMEHVIVVAHGQEYRINDPKYSKNVKYHWYTATDGSEIKIYKQVRRVKYADYIPGKYYVSVHEVTR